MQFYSGPLMHFLFGVDTGPQQSLRVQQRDMMAGRAMDFCQVASFEVLDPRGIEGQHPPILCSRDVLGINSPVLRSATTPVRAESIPVVAGLASTQARKFCPRVQPSPSICRTRSKNISGIAGFGKYG
jgi:hypothetical protein